MRTRGYYEDGLKECSWIPDTFEEFQRYCAEKTVITDNYSIMLLSGDDSFRYVDTIYVLKEHRGQGKATKMLKSLEGRVAVISSERMEGFYESLGFTKHLPYSVMIKDKR